MTTRTLADAVAEHADLVDVAARLGTTTGKLLQLAKAGKFPPLVRLTRRSALVRLDHLERWIAEHAMSPETERQRSLFVHDLGRPSVRDSAAPHRKLPVRRGHVR